jgi:hypothetical protein
MGRNSLALEDVWNIVAKRIFAEDRIDLSSRETWLITKYQPSTETIIYPDGDDRMQAAPALRDEVDGRAGC